MLLSLEDWMQPPQLWHVAPWGSRVAVLNTGLQTPGSFESLDD